MGKEGKTFILSTYQVKRVHRISVAQGNLLSNMQVETILNVPAVDLPEKPAQSSVTSPVSNLYFTPSCKAEQSPVVMNHLKKPPLILLHFLINTLYFRFLTLRRLVSVFLIQLLS